MRRSETNFCAVVLVLEVVGEVVALSDSAWLRRPAVSAVRSSSIPCARPWCEISFLRAFLSGLRGRRAKKLRSIITGSNALVSSVARTEIPSAVVASA